MQDSLCQTDVPILGTIYILLKLLTTWLTHFCTITYPKLNYFVIAYTTCTNPVL